MLSTLGKNIGIAVEIVSSHLYFSPSQVHPSPDLGTDPAFWFAAQCSRLRFVAWFLLGALGGVAISGSGSRASYTSWLGF